FPVPTLYLMSRSQSSIAPPRMRRYTLRVLTRKSVTQLKCCPLSVPLSQYSMTLTLSTAQCANRVTPSGRRRTGLSASHRGKTRGVTALLCRLLDVHFVNPSSVFLLDKGSHGRAC